MYLVKINKTREVSRRNANNKLISKRVLKPVSYKSFKTLKEAKSYIEKINSEHPFTNEYDNTTKLISTAIYKKM